MAQEFGSQNPGTKSRASKRLALDATAKATLFARCALAETEFRTGPLPALAPLVFAPETLHHRLYDGLFDPAVVGIYRGAKGTGLEAVKRVVRTRGALAGLRKTGLCMPPQDVTAGMATLSLDLHKFWDHAANAGSLTRLTHDFFWVHPFLDGNGHVWRLMAIALARRAALTVSPEWHVHTRPYGPEFSLGLQCFPQNPDLLHAEMAAFFGPQPGALTKSG